MSNENTTPLPFFRVIPEYWTKIRIEGKSYPKFYLILQVTTANFRLFLCENQPIPLQGRIPQIENQARAWIGRTPLTAPNENRIAHPEILAKDHVPHKSHFLDRLKSP